MVTGKSTSDTPGSSHTLSSVLSMSCGSVMTAVVVSTGLPMAAYDGRLSASTWVVDGAN